MAFRGSRIFGLVATLLVFPTIASAPRGISPNAPTTFTVNSTADSSDASPGDGICDAGAGVCTLRAAIEEANANVGADTIHFNIGTGAQTISPATVYPALT